jgi:hypothetical protein
MVSAQLKPRRVREFDVSIELAKSTLQGTLCLPEAAKGIVLFVHGSGSSRLSARKSICCRGASGPWNSNLVI